MSDLYFGIECNDLTTVLRAKSEVFHKLFKALSNDKVAPALGAINADIYVVPTTVVSTFSKGGLIISKPDSPDLLDEENLSGSGLPIKINASWLRHTKLNEGIKLDTPSFIVGEHIVAYLDRLKTGLDYIYASYIMPYKINKKISWDQVRGIMTTQNVPANDPWFRNEIPTNPER